MVNHCPTCGQKVKVSQSEEGTGSYIPAEFEEAKRRVLEIIKQLKTINKKRKLTFVELYCEGSDDTLEELKQKISAMNPGFKP